LISRGVNVELVRCEPYRRKIMDEKLSPAERVHGPWAASVGRGLQMELGLEEAGQEKEMHQIDNSSPFE
jgi:hypothetical protein